jgi:hypothetical protein
MNVYPLTITDMTTTALVTYQGKNYMFLIDWFDGEYIVNTRAFGPAFEGFRGRGLTVSQAVTDFLNAITVHVGLMAEAQVQYIKDTKYPG